MKKRKFEIRQYKHPGRNSRPEAEYFEWYISARKRKKNEVEWQPEAGKTGWTEKSGMLKIRKTACFVYVRIQVIMQMSGRI